MKRQGKDYYMSPTVDILLLETTDVLRTSDGIPLDDGDGIMDTWTPLG